MTQPDGADILAELREQVLEQGRGATPSQVLELLRLGGPDGTDRLEQLLELAHEVRMRWCGPEVEVEGIISLKTGGCPEDCHFCSQSGLFASPVRSAWLDIPALVEAAKQTAKTGATEFCIVYAVRGPDRRLMDHVLECTARVHKETNLDVACSLGILTREQAFELAANGVHRYNHNLEAARSYFPEICTTHGWEERLETCLLVRETGMELCSGGIIGLGESREQRVELAFQLAELDPHEVPMNFLNPRPGTPLADNTVVEPEEAVRTIALFRLALPATVMRYGGGREITLGDLQALGLKAGINALITGNYLTTLGQTLDDDLAMLNDLSMPVKAVSKVL
jgi:biotin synthase